MVPIWMKEKINFNIGHEYSSDFLAGVDGSDGLHMSGKSLGEGP